MKNKKKSVINALVIDDNEVNILVLINMLEVFGINTEQANSGHKALHMIQKKVYNIIFIDHLMPGMDGINTTSTIRNTSPAYSNAVIIAISTEVTEQIRKLYRFAGANEVFMKPLGLLELSTILKKWFPEIVFNEISIKQEQRNPKEFTNIRVLLEDIREIDYMAAKIDVIQYPKQFINLLEVSLKDIQSSINIIIDGYDNDSLKLLQLSVHKLKGIFGNIGAIDFQKKIRSFEVLISDGDLDEIHSGCLTFRKDLEEFKKKLNNMLNKYYELLVTEEAEYIPLSKDEYEQCLLNTIYYIRRYEYEAIIRELERLIFQGYHELKQEYESALFDIKNFDYDRALERIIKIKNETGNLPVPENNKIIQFKNFWDED